MLVRDGYICARGNHLITHQILAKERGGYYESELSNLKTMSVENDIPPAPPDGWPTMIHNGRRGMDQSI